MSEKDISTSWTDPDDAPRLTEDWFAEADAYVGERLVRRGRPRSANPKKAVSLRLDADLVDWLKASGEGWQTRINRELRKIAGL